MVKYEDGVDAPHNDMTIDEPSFKGKHIIEIRRRHAKERDQKVMQIQL